MNVNIGSFTIYNTDIHISDDGMELTISYLLTDENPSLEGVQNVFEDPQPLICVTDDDVETRYFGYLSSELSSDGKTVQISLSKPDIETRVDYLFDLILGLKNACATPVVVANSMINEHVELLGHMVDNMLKGGN